MIIKIKGISVLEKINPQIILDVINDQLMTNVNSILSILIISQQEIKFFKKRK
jgi:hypothetical protein